MDAPLRARDLSFPMKQFWVTHEALIRMGFLARDIFATTVRHDDHAHAALLLQAQNRTFTAMFDPVVSEDDFRREYQDVAPLSLTMPEEDRKTLWDELMPLGRLQDMLVALDRKGFQIPCTLS